MSATLQQTLDEIDFLVGATVEKVEVEHDDDAFGFDAVAITFRLKQPIKDGATQKSSDLVRFQVWEDPEGNGPGYLSLVAIGSED